MSKSNVKTEKYDLPGTIDGICSLVREILAGGHVSHLELDHNENRVRAQRWVEETGLEEDEVSWDGALRNLKVMKEYYSEGATSFQVVVDLMLLAQAENLQCICWITGTGDEDLLRRWFDLDGRKLPIGEIENLMGIPVRRLKSLPEETLVLCCSKYPSADPSEISMAVKTTMELRRDHDTANGKDDDRGGDNSEEHSTGARPLALTTGGLRRVSWSPPGTVGH